MNSTHRRTALGVVPVSAALLALLLSATPASASVIPSSHDDSSSGSSSHGSNSGRGSDDDSDDDDSDDDDSDDDHGRGGHGSDDGPGDDHGRGGHGSDDSRGPSANSGSAANATTTVNRRGRVIVRQQCGTIATKLKVKPDNGGTEVEYELDQNVNGVSWTLSLTRNGTSVATATRTTQPPSGSFEWELHTSNPAGSDRYTVTAVNGSTTCTISATL